MALNHAWTRLRAGLWCLILVACTVPSSPTPSLPTSTPTPPYSHTWSGAIVTTVAGKCYPTARDYVDGFRDEARFCKPCGLGVDAQGNLLVADCFNHCIRRVSPEGLVTTVAGVCGDRADYLDGPADQARFFWPTHAIADPAGTIYVADSWNNRVRLITSEGMVSTLAGGDPGYRDGTGHLARFGRPNGLVLNREGDILVADLDNNCIRKITPEGMVTTIAGSEERAYADGPALQARFGAPNSLAFDSDGNLYVAEAFYGHNLPRDPSGWAGGHPGRHGRTGLQRWPGGGGPVRSSGMDGSWARRRPLRSRLRQQLHP
jgi:DNA-binding beta-propeller fold protein YncE